jgi:hypothetical protein
LKGEDVSDIYQEVVANPPAAGHGAESLVPLAFFIGDEMPEVLAFRRIWSYQSQLRLVPLSLTMVRSALREHSASRDLDRLVQQSGRQMDLYDVRSPAVDQLEFFGRQELLERVSASLNKSQSVDVWGLPSMGKTSLLWRLKETLVNPIVAYADFGYGWQGRNGFQVQILKDLTRDLWLKYDRFLEIEEGTAFEDQLLSVAEAVPGEEAGQARIVLLLDDVSVMPPVEQKHILDALRGLAEEAALALVVTWRDAVLPLVADQALPPLSEEACTTLMVTLGARMGLDFAPESLLRVYQETGGHPFLLRQLGSAIARQVPASHAPPEFLQVTLAWVERALAAYLPLRDDYFEEVWQWLSPDQREAVRAWGTMVDGERVQALAPYPHLQALFLLDEGGLGELFRAWVVAEVREDRL